MSEFKGTPGPWNSDATLGHRIYSENKTLIATPGYMREASVEIANSRLIAAAPMMLEVLQKIASTFDAESYSNPASIERQAGDKARAAIAKALP